MDILPDNESYRDHIATVTQDGKRIWLRPEQPFGRFYDRRKLLSYGLLVVLFALPFLEINGEPLFLFDVLGRKFRIFGIGFDPQDLYLAGLTMVTGVVAIAMFTVVFGRVFCGWICPQTIFMEMVFRRIEYWIDGSAAQQRRLDKADWTAEKIRKRVFKHSIFFAISVIIANLFLSYIIGWREVYRIATEPIGQNIYGFAAMIVFSGVFYGVFARLREQVCTSICPYGRLQSVLVDNDSVGVSYDEIRGEPRGKKAAKRSGTPVQPATVSTTSIVAMASGAGSLAEDIAISDTKEAPLQLGDCIDCGLCVRVCPTGIDIRDGINQLECVHCTACIDACDSIMDKIQRPRGLIRYASANTLQGMKRPLLTKRAYGYAAVLSLLVFLNAFLLLGRGDIEATIMRTPGMLFHEPTPGTVANLYNYQLSNKTDRVLSMQFAIEGMPEAKIRYVGAEPLAQPHEQARGSVFVDIPRNALQERSTAIRIQVMDAEGEVLEVLKTNFFGPN